tara:strand:- start:5 stop:367 length:363 start_codon:yes stop_codon:yes gene_type:complete
MAPQKRARIEDDEEVIAVESASSALRHEGVGLTLRKPFTHTHILPRAIRKHVYQMNRKPGMPQVGALLQPRVTTIPMTKYLMPTMRQPFLPAHSTKLKGTMASCISIIPRRMMRRNARDS